MHVNADVSAVSALIHLKLSVLMHTYVNSILISLHIEFFNNVVLCKAIAVPVSYSYISKVYLCLISILHIAYTYSAHPQVHWSLLT